MKTQSDIKIVTHKLSFSPESGGKAKPSRANDEIKIDGTTYKPIDFVSNLHESAYQIYAVVERTSPK